MQSIEKQIETIIKRKARGTLVTSSDFSSLGSSEAIRKALDRLENKQVIVRVAHGIYVRPKMSKLIGPLQPTAEEIVEAIAKRDKIRTIPTGSFALHVLGLSTQIPMNIVLLTDGSPRKIKLGNRVITFKKTTPKNLSVKGNVSSLVIQALKEIGNNNLSESDEQKIMDILKKEDPLTLAHDCSLAPTWIQKILKKATHYDDK